MMMGFSMGTQKPTQTIESVPWIEKYRPKKIKEMAQNDGIIDLFNNIMRTGNIPHMLFYGPPGTGKTSSILAIGRETYGEHFSSRVIEFNASDDRGINAVREKITFEAKKSVGQIENPDGSIVPAYKIIILDEADSMTDEAQDALRVIIEEYSGVTRFCFICNYISKITDAIKSRCSKVYFKKLPDECMITKLKEISVAESMKLSNDIFGTIADISAGDMRKAIMLLQNIKYEYEFKKSNSKKLSEMTEIEMRSFYPVIGVDLESGKSSTDITPLDIYNISATIAPSVAEKIVDEIIKCKSIIEISFLSKKIVNMGYPIDNIIMQINNIILRSKKFSDLQKAKIFQKGSLVAYGMKECANEYVQLLHFLSEVYMISN